MVALQPLLKQRGGWKTEGGPDGHQVEGGRGLELLKQEQRESGDWKQPEAATARAIEEDKTSAISFHTVD